MPDEFYYNDMLGKMANVVNAKLSEMATVYNFDYGDEFEIALCHLFRSILPHRYRICRGFVITKDNRRAGDDIIIFDRELSIPLRLLPEGDYSRKEQVPAEFVYGYVDLKSSTFNNHILF